MNNTVKLEVTEDYEIDTTGNAYIETAYACFNESYEPIPKFSKRLMKEFDNANVDVIGVIGPVENVNVRVDKGRKNVEWTIKRHSLAKNDPCVCLLRAKLIGIASKIKNLHVLKISYSPSEQIGYTLTVRLPKLSDLEKSWAKRLFYGFEIIKGLQPEKETTDSGNPVIKWRVPELNHKFEVDILYGARFRTWLAQLITIVMAPVLIEIVLRFILHL